MRSINLFLAFAIVVGSISRTRGGETTYTAIFWNIHSGDSEAATIGSNMAQKGAVDFWGLSEVPSDPAFLDALESQIEAATGIDYVKKISNEGNEDRLAILYNSEAFSSIPYTGNAAVVDLGSNFFEVASINTSGTVRPSLGIQLQDDSGQAVVVLINHWKAKGDRRSRNIRISQAEATNTFVSETPDVPVIVAGDHNIPINRQGGRQQQAFNRLTRVFEYIEPENPVRGMSSFRSGSLLDSVFVARELPDWTAKTMVLNRVGNRPATTNRFNDDDRTSDHRPLRLVLTGDSESRIEALEEEQRAAEAHVESLRTRIAALRGAESGE